MNNHSLTIDELIQYYNLTQKKYQHCIITIQELRVKKSQEVEREPKYNHLLCEIERMIIKETNKLYKLGVVLRETQIEIERTFERGKWNGFE